jgi:hypothetical protein
LLRHASRVAQFSASRRRTLAKSGAAMKHGGYPILNVKHLEDAIQAIGRAKDPAATKRHIVKRAKALGAASKLPVSWL